MCAVADKSCLLYAVLCSYITITELSNIMSYKEKEQVKTFFKDGSLHGQSGCRTGHCTLQQLEFCLDLTMSVGICLLCLVGM